MDLKRDFSVLILGLTVLVTLVIGQGSLRDDSGSPCYESSEENKLGKPQVGLIL